MFGVKFTSHLTLDLMHKYYKQHPYHYHFLIRPLHSLTRPSGHLDPRIITCQYNLSHADIYIITCRFIFITCRNILSHADLFYHILDHYESYLVIMPPFSILSLHNAKTTLEYKRETEFCTLVSSPPLGSHPHSLFPYLDLLVSTHIAIQGYFLVTIYLF